MRRNITVFLSCLLFPLLAAVAAAGDAGITVTNDTGALTVLDVTFEAPGVDSKKSDLGIAPNESATVRNPGLGRGRVTFSMGMNDVVFTFPDVPLAQANALTVGFDNDSRPLLKVLAGGEVREEVSGRLSQADLSGEGPELRYAVFKWEVDAVYPELGVAPVDAALRDWLNGFVNRRVDEVKEFFDLDDARGGWSMWVNHSVTRPSDKAVSVIFETFAYPFRAAHPTGSIDVRNHFLPTGEEVTLDALFEDPDKALAIFAEGCPKLISEQFKSDNPEQFPNGVEDDFWFTEGFAPTRENYANLGLEPEGVRVYFQQYQILPYVFGMPSPLVPLSALEAAGPNREIWARK